jgi:hypothetical protein
MTDKTFCEKCSRWHTEKEGHVTDRLRNALFNIGLINASGKNSNPEIEKIVRDAASI